MKKQNSLKTHIIAFTVFILFMLACGGSKLEPTTPANSTNSSSSPTNSSGNSANTTNTTPTTAAVKEIAGSYGVKGTNVNGQGTYEGNLTITKRGEVYQFSWDVGGSKYDGVGVLTDNAIAVSYTEGADGKGCGVALYKIGSDGSLDGKSGYWGSDNGETEKATRTSGTDLAGEYDATGKNPKGEEYKSKLTILPSGPGFTFKWKGSNAIDGLGVRQGNFAVAGFGGKQCSFVAYEIKSDGSLEGRWGGLGTVTFGTEKAVKK
ncbi:MAG TPA: hypothetical protein PKY82_21225 [Pyrinomonadaceae bacterium]|nr:hypothetical protein [Pyrinomonadaceae bacterium]